MIKATYTAGEASRVIRDALADIGEDVGDLEVTIAAAGTSAGTGARRAAAGEALEGIRILPRPPGMPPRLRIRRASFRRPA